jgi:thiol-disulfide isomerase/thioredoxin
MHRPRVTLLSVIVTLTVSVAARAVQPQTPASSDIVADVRAAMAEGGLTRAEETLGAYRSAHGTTAEALEAQCWLARGALADKLYDRAVRYADEVHTKAAALRAQSADSPALLNTIECGIEVASMTLVEQGGRSDAVYGLRKAIDEFGSSSIADRLRWNLSLVTVEGQSAPTLEAGVSAGARLTRATSGGRQPQLLFFWAHWCQDCKAESPMVAKIAEKYSHRGLAIVAPTRRYGYVENGRPAPPDKELRHIINVRDKHYAFLKRAAIPVTDANFKAFGVAAVPMHVLIDRSGTVRLYRPGRMTEAELEAAIVEVVGRP